MITSQDFPYLPKRLQGMDLNSSTPHGTKAIPFGKFILVKRAYSSPASCVSSFWGASGAHNNRVTKSIATAANPVMTGQDAGQNVCSECHLIPPLHTTAICMTGRPEEGVEPGITDRSSSPQQL